MNRLRCAVAIGILMSLIMTVQATADCFFNGRRVPEGTRVGPLVCQDGQWVERP